MSSWLPGTFCVLKFWRSHDVWYRMSNRLELKFINTHRTSIASVFLWHSNIWNNTYCYSQSRDYRLLACWTWPCCLLLYTNEHVSDGCAVVLDRIRSATVTNSRRKPRGKWKKRSERRKHCALAVVRRSQTFSPHRRPPSRDAGRPKFNQLEMVTTFTYRPSLVKIDARNFELSW